MVERVHLEEMGWESLGPLLKRKVIDGARMTMTRYSFEPSGRFPLHQHDQEQITHVLLGALTFVLDDGEYPLEAGDVIVIAPDARHSAVAGDQGAEVLSVVSPARTEGRGVRMLEE